MEQVIVRIYHEDGSSFKKFGAHFERKNGERTVVATGSGYQIAKDKANAAIYECDWEPFQPDRKDGLVEIGHGWVDASGRVSS